MRDDDCLTDTHLRGTNVFAFRCCCCRQATGSRSRSWCGGCSSTLLRIYEFLMNINSMEFTFRSPTTHIKPTRSEYSIKSALIKRAASSVKRPSSINLPCSLINSKRFSVTLASAKRALRPCAPLFRLLEAGEEHYCRFPFATCKHARS
jgi:hypothetical protein